MSEPTTSLRDSIEAALEEKEATSTPDVSTNSEVLDTSPEPVQETAQNEQVESAGPDLNAIAEGDTDSDQAQQPDRDDQGKFKKAAEGVQPGPKSGPKQNADRPPASWKPEIREHWAQLPEGVRSEVARRESEVARTLQETVEARRTAESVMKTIAPYEAFIRAEGSNPLQAIDNLMSTAARLRTGTAPELAQMVAGLVNQFGIGRFGNTFIEQLDSALAGQTPQAANPQTSAIEQVLNQRLAPMQNMLTQFQNAQQARQQQEVYAAQNEVSQFLNKAEFGEDVREDMADLLEVSQRRGQNLTLQQAYDRACMMNDSVSKVVQQRQRAQGAMQRGDAAQRAKAAAVSVSGAAPVGALRQASTDVRSAIEAAIAMNTR